MAYVSRTTAPFTGRTRTAAWSVSVSTDDLLVAVVSSDGLSWSGSGVPTLSSLGGTAGWTYLGEWSMGSLGRGEVDSVLGVWTRRVTSGGTLSGAFTWAGDMSPYSRVDILRYSAMRGGVEVRAQRQNSQTLTYPALSGVQVASTGHALRIGNTSPLSAGSQSKLIPSAHTQRVATQNGTYSPYGGDWGWFVVSDQSLTSALPAVAASTASRMSGWAITVYLAGTLGPGAPDVDLGAMVDLTQAGGTPVGWVPDGEQTAVRITRKSLPSGSVEYLTALSGGSWTATPTTITTTATAATLPTSGFTGGGAQWLITVATVGGASHPDLGAADEITVTSWQAPTATSITYDGRTSGTSTTRVGWLAGAGAAGSGATLDTVQVQLRDATTGEVYADGLHAPAWWYAVPADPPIPNNITVKARARVRQQGDQWSAWVETGAITIAQPVPSAPVLDVSPITHPVSGLPGLGVQVTSAGGTVRVYRDGVLLGEWTSSGTLTVEDYLPPTDVALAYTATVTDGAVPPATSPVGSVASVLPTAGGHCWLTDPLHPEGAVQAHCAAFEESVGHPSTAYHPLGVAAPVGALVHSLPARTPSGSITLRTKTPAQLDAVVSLLSRGVPLYFRRWVETDTDGQSHPVPPLRFVPVGDVSIDRLVAAPITARTVTVGWVTA